MTLTRSNALSLAVAICLVTPLGVWGSQPNAPDETTVGSRLILGLRPISVSFITGLDAGEPPYRALLSAADPSSGPSGRIRIGQLGSHPLLRIGTLDGSELSESDDGDTDGRRGSLRYDLWLARTDGSSWVLEAQREDSEDGTVGSEVVGTIPLTQETAAAVAPTLAAALVPTGEDEGQLILTWGTHRWTAGFAFADPPESPAGGDGAGGTDGARDFDSDTSAIARAVTLAERHETTVILPDDATISILFWQELATEHPDFDGVASLGDGQVLRLTEAAATRLRTEVPLRFGRVTVPTDNLAPDFPGSYALWLKRIGDGWRLVFNHEADSWGTQHHREFDAAEVDLAYSQRGSSRRPLGVVLEPTSESGGRLVIHWGPHEWATDFTVGS